TYPRLAHVGDRTGLELIRTMQQKIVRGLVLVPVAPPCGARSFCRAEAVWGVPVPSGDESIEGPVHRSGGGQPTLTP
ncbi:hypothetical protein ACFWFU_40815, partial [Streptomyces sp. NPDC060235]|uniref:hypothetical protein n=1 Tax=Streptomyces sp. NPDC060235 TaxID=3347080 RepID=UPI00365A4FE8